MTTDAQKIATNRLKIIQGHLRRVTEMVEEGRYCPEIIQQLNAVASSLDKVEGILLEGHLRSCVTNAIKSNGGEKEIKELLEAFKRR